MEQPVPLNSLPDPLDQYPPLNLRALKALNTDNNTFRRKGGYGLGLYQQIGQKSELLRCAYCGIPFDNFTCWLMLSVDHVVPKAAAIALGIDKNLWDSALNLIFCCRICNDFNDGLKHSKPEEVLKILPPYQPELVKQPEEFLRLRKATFPRRLEDIAAKRADAQQIYQSLWAPNAP
jgi:5-methylcytosine-specific restriction endonuclease McrA